MPYAGLGARTVVAAADNTGNNPGNYTNVFDPSTLANTVPWAEIYRAVVSGATPGATVRVCVDSYPCSWNLFGSGAEWDPAQPPLIQPGQTVFFYWSLPSTETPAPIVTLWLRYDTDQPTAIGS